LAETRRCQAADGILAFGDAVEITHAGTLTSVASLAKTERGVVLLMTFVAMIEIDEENFF
jgi:hypothetical protein